MKKRLQRAVSIMLSMVMLVSSANIVLADDDTSKEMYFDFEYTDYEVAENAGELKVKLVRHGNALGSADVLFKAADFLSSYGDDYEILDSDGNPLEKVYGTKPDVSDFVFDETTTGSSLVTSEEEFYENRAEYDKMFTSDNDTEPDDETELDDDTVSSSVFASALSVYGDEDNADNEVTQSSVNETVGGSLKRAQAEYLNLPVTDLDAYGDESDSVDADDVDKSLTEMYDYFAKAEGAQGIVHFGYGESEKELTIVIHDNDIAEADKLFMLAVTSTNGDNAVVAPNATTYITITDDEEYETPRYSLEDTKTVLTENAPEAEITIKRTTGLQYFSTVYLSTVDTDNNTEAYEQFNLKTVAFIPGETEKTVTVKATDFSEDTGFGLRLESENEGTIDNHYIHVDIKKAGNNTNATDIASGTISANGISDADDISDASLEAYATESALGSAQTIPTNNVYVSGGWKFDKSGSDGGNWGSKGNNYLYLQQYDKSCYSMFVTNNKINLMGVKTIDAQMETGGDGSGFTTFFETDSDQTYPGSLQSLSYGGKSGRQWRSLNVAVNNNESYLKFAAEATKAGKHNPKATLSGIRFNWANYSFSLENSAETFVRKAYDFTSLKDDGTPNVYDIYYDGATTRQYNPGPVTITKSGTSTSVSGFYGNNTSAVVIESANASANSEKGLTLVGVYFAKSSVSTSTMYKNSRYTTDNVLYKAATNGKVTITPDQSFLAELQSAGVISAYSTDESIKIYPVYKQTDVRVIFENTDRTVVGKYDKDNKASYIDGVLEAYDAGFATKRYAYNGALISVFFNMSKINKSIECYTITVPQDSVIRVHTSPISTRSAAGVKYWYMGSSDSYITYYKEGDTKSSGTSTVGETITQTDYTRAEVVASRSLYMCPATGEQSFYVGYSPVSYNAIMESYRDGQKLVTTLKNAVIDSESGKGTNEKGNMTFTDAAIGKNYSLMAFAPEGYYPSWANFTGDTDNDGDLDNNKSEISVNNERSKSSNPIYIHGSRLNVKLDQDNTRYYYEFRAKDNNVVRVKKGTVQRENNTLMRIADGKSATSYTPVSGAYVNIAGFTGMTDANGDYSIEIGGLPSWGSISTSLTVDGVESYAVGSIEQSKNYTLKALEQFTASKGAVSATYASSGAQSGSMIRAKDEMLTITAKVSTDNALRPEQARFFIGDADGNKLIDCTQDDNYTISTIQNSGEITAKLTFNPKIDMDANSKVYVQFADQNGTWYTPIDVGYTFIPELSIGKIIFPLIGSSTFEDATTNNFVTDIIGNPLSNMNISSLNLDESEDNDYSPAGIPNDDKDNQDYKWTRTTLSNGWSEEFGNNSITDQIGDLLEKLKGSDDVGKKTGGGFQNEGSFTWSLKPSVGFSLTISTRMVNDGTGKYVTKNYFEDLLFVLKLDFDVSSENTISTPIGIGIVINAELEGNVTGVYYMYTDYAGDSYETENAALFDSENFGLFKKFSNSVRREGYLFLNPTISIEAGVEVSVISVTIKSTFAFDMDFKFEEDKTSTYGDVGINLSWAIKVAGFQVYSYKFWDKTVKMFNSEGQTEHIEFTKKDISALQALSVDQYLSNVGDAPISNELTARDYLKNRSSWNGSTGGTLKTMAADGATVESTLRTGTAEDNRVNMVKIDDDNMLMIFVDDAPSRTDVNKRAVYYSVGNGSKWSEPVIIDDDGTMDDYPNLVDLGNGKILAAWSSADKVLGNDATVEDALSSLNIQVAFFDKASMSFEPAETLTKTTDEDYTADVMPRAAYDSATDRIILFYTKTEYINLENVSDIGNAYSVNAYLFYEDGKWSNDGSVYTDEELSGVKGTEAKEEYREQWYGQRFLDLRLDSSSDLLRVVDTDAISYNGLALFTWTADWDNNLDTVDDRDVFVQIYNFSENSFTHIIRITSDTGTYSLPKLARSAQATYLFYGQVDKEDENEDENESVGKIMYIDLSNIIKNDKLEKVTQGGTNYYIFAKSEDSTQTVETEDGTQTIKIEGGRPEADTAAYVSNVTDYDVSVNESGEIYLLWTTQENDARQISAAMLNGSVYDDQETDDGSSSEDVYWSEAVTITDTAKDTYYMGLGVSVIDGAIYIGSGKHDYNDEANNKLVLVKHIPQSDVKAESVSVDNKYPKVGENVVVSAVVKNNGLLPETKPVNVTFELNGKVLGTSSFDGNLPGGTETTVMFNAEIPEGDADNYTFKAYVDDTESVEKVVEHKADLEVLDEDVELTDKDGTYKLYKYSAAIQNQGNKTSDAIDFTVYAAGESVGTQTVEALEPNAVGYVDIEFVIPDEVYLANESVTLNVQAVSGEDTVHTYDDYVENIYDFDVIDQLSKVTGVDTESTYTLTKGESTQVKPVVNTSGDDELSVLWLESSDPSVATIDYSNDVVAYSEGTATLTGIVAPDLEKILFDTNGDYELLDWSTVIPESKYITVTAVVNVVADSSETTETTTEATTAKATEGTTKTVSDSSRGGGRSSSKASSQAEKDNTVTDVDTEVTTTSVFNDIAGHWAENVIANAAALGIVSGYADNSFKPNNSITRAEFVAMLYNSGLADTKVKSEVKFNDVNGNEWYAEYLVWAASNGIITGYEDNTFRGNNVISRQETAVVVSKFIAFVDKDVEDVASITFKDEADIAPWAKPYVDDISAKSIVNGDNYGNFNPKKDLTRAETAVIITNIK